MTNFNNWIISNISKALLIFADAVKAATTDYPPHKPLKQPIPKARRNIIDLIVSTTPQDKYNKPASSM